MRIKETCCCGASIDVSDDWSPSVTTQVGKFHEQHKNCTAPRPREKLCGHKDLKNWCGCCAARSMMGLDNPDTGS